MDGKIVSSELLGAARHTEAMYQVASSITDIRVSKEEFEVLVVWEGLPYKSDWMWESMEKVIDGMTEFLRKFPDTTGKTILKKSHR